MEKCVFDRDTLFHFVILSDHNASKHLKFQNLTSIQLQQTPEYKKYFKNWYYYSNKLPIFNFANDEYISRHQIKEIVIVMSTSDFIKHGIVQKLVLGFFVDYDLAMVN